MIEYIALVLAIPLGMILSIVTRKERRIYEKPVYFPAINLALAALAIIGLAYEKVAGMAILFMLVMTFVWWRWD